MKLNHKSKKDNLGWEIIKLQAQVGESTSRKAMKIVEAEKKKEQESSLSAGTSHKAEGREENEQEQEQEQGQVSDAALSEAAQKLLKLKEQKISQKIYHAKKEIRKAFVKAKAFETQRLVKRLREARKAVEEKENKSEAKEGNDKPTHKKKHDLTQEDITKFENEMELVKKMDMDSLSEHAFVAKLAKHPILGSHQLMVPYSTVTINKKENVTQDDATAATIQIIEARLTNTKTVKEHMSKLWDELEHIITGKKGNEEKNKKRTAIDDQNGSKNKKSKTHNDTKEADSDNEESEDEEMVGMSGVDYDISDSEREDDGYDSDGLPLPMGGKSKGSSSSLSSMFIGSLNEGKKSKKDKKGKKDKNDWVDDKFDEIYGKPKKNRPGQQARRAKAERKYGKEANHIKKAEEEARIRAEKKAARKAKQEKFIAQRDASKANAEVLPGRRIIGAGDGSASVIQPKKNAFAAKNAAPSGPDLNDPTLHPSWIAKQTEKAAMAAALAGAKNNKITFDDSD
ncbi:hypothetical protein FBU30_001218 [Linnemannia zychae]|nr:hypothetical protein FBU30_001218 [Linnemannia zychae]